MTAAPSPALAPPVEPRRPGPSRRRSQVPTVTRRAQARLGVLLVLPLVAVMGVFLLFPMASAVYDVFVDFDGIDLTPPFVGLFRDPKVWDAFQHNAIWIVLGTVAPLALRLALALLRWHVQRGGVVCRVVFFLPYVLPQVAVAVVWGWIYSPSRGWLNRGLELVGLGRTRP